MGTRAMGKRKSGMVCAAKNCGNKAYNSNLAFFSFPKENERAQKWLKACGREDLHEKIGRLRSYRLCAAHFENNMYTNVLKTRLLPSAVPTLFTLLEGSLSRIDIEHNYCITSGQVWSSTSSEVKMSFLESVSNETALNNKNDQMVHHCKNCPYFTKSWFFIQNHIKRHKEGKLLLPFNCSTSTPEKFLCKDCNFETYETVTFNNHINNHNWLEVIVNGEPFEHDLNHDDNLFSCDTLSASMGAENGKDMVAAKNEWFYCKQCSYKGRQKVHLQRHILNRHKSSEDVEWFYCDKCSFKTKYESYLPVHKASKHPISKKPQWFRCNKCRYSTRSEICYKNHKHHIIKKYFLCDKCSYKTNHEPNLSRHIIDRHTALEDIDWFHCDQCTFKTKQNTTLKIHKVTKHSSEENIKYLQCDKCPYKTFRQHWLKSHTTRKHTPMDEIKWFNCDKCPFRTHSEVYYKKHKHLDDQRKKDVFKFECEKCPYGTDHGANLKRHIIAKHTAFEDINWYRCGHCDFQSKEKRTLKYHVMSRHLPSEDMKRFHCDKCSYKSFKKSALKVHMTTKHVPSVEIKWGQVL